MYQYRITVFTPTYNRGYILEQLYDSLKRQTFHNFEWLIVDDGSTDQTENYVNKWILEDHHFPIRYYKTVNGGKHRAINYGLNIAQGEIFFTVDSDDHLTCDALDKIDMWFLGIESDKNLVGIVANRGYRPGFTINKFFQEPYLDKKLSEMNTFQENDQFVLAGERAIAMYTDINKQYIFPEFAGEKFITEAVVYNRISNDGYRFRFYNDIIWIYEYREDGLTKAGSSMFLNNPQGYGLWLREKAEFEGVSFLDRMKMYYTFTCDMSTRISNKEIAKCIGASHFTIGFLHLLHKIKQIIRK